MKGDQDDTTEMHPGMEMPFAVQQALAEHIFRQVRRLFGEVQWRMAQQAGLSVDLVDVIYGALADAYEEGVAREQRRRLDQDLAEINGRAGRMLRAALQHSDLAQSDPQKFQGIVATAYIGDANEKEEGL